MIQLKRRMKERIGQLVCSFTVRHGLCEYLHIDQVHGGVGVLPYKRLMGMCRWMGTNFHDWIDYNVVAFSIALLDITRMGPKCPPPPNPGPCAFSLFCLLFVCTPNFLRNGSKLHILGLWHWVFSVTLERTPAESNFSLDRMLHVYPKVLQIQS